MFEYFSLASNKFEPIQQKTLRPKLTRAEGFILGVGAKMFTIAGPVIMHGTNVSVRRGLERWGKSANGNRLADSGTWGQVPLF